MLRKIEISLLFWVLLGGLVGLFAAPLHQTEPLILNNQTDRYVLGKHLEFLQDPEGQYSFESVRSKAFASLWKKSEWDIPNFGINPEVHWFRFTLQRSDTTQEDYYLEVGNSELFLIEFYQVQPNGSWTLKPQGRKFPFAQREIAAPKFAYRLDLPLDHPKTFYLRVESYVPLYLPLYVSKSTAFWGEIRKEQLLLGIYVGLLLTAALHNFFIWLSIRGRSYLLYVIYVCFLTLFMMSQSGVAYEYLWPDFPLLAQRDTPFFGGVSLVFGLLFARRFLLTHKYAPRMDRVLSIFNWITLLALGSILVFAQDNILPFIIMIGGVLILSTAGIVWKQGYRPARYFFMGWLVLISAAVFLAFQILGWIPYYPWTTNVMLMGSMVEVILLSFALSDRYKAIESEKQALTKTFEKFVPKQFLQRIAADGLEHIPLGKAKTEFITILFSDIRAFSNLAESLTPQEVMDFLNNYLTDMNRPIHNSYGFIDKFIGDAIMGLFDRPAHSAQDAVTAAMGMVQAIQSYNDQQTKQGRAPIQIGIGIHSGEVIMGTVGSEDRMDSTVLGDSVNLASRLEGLTSYYNAQIMISSQTYRLLEDDKLLCRELDFIVVKGKQKPETVFEVFSSDPEFIRSKKQKLLEPYHEGLTHYHSRNWQAAQAAFLKCLSIYPEDVVSQTYLARCRHYEHNPPPNDWDGSFQMEHK